MARFIQLISPILYRPSPGRLFFDRSIGPVLIHGLAWILVACAFFFCWKSGSTLLLAVGTVQLAFSSLILLETFLGKMNAGPLTSRRLEMTAYCIGGAVLLLLSIYQFSEAYVCLRHPVKHTGFLVPTAVLFSIVGNLMLVRWVWRSGLIRIRLRIYCPPLLGILLLDLLSFLSSLVIRYTPFQQFDALLAIAASIFLFIVTAGLMIDSYWRLTELEEKILKTK